MSHQIKDKLWFNRICIKYKEFNDYVNKIIKKINSIDKSYYIDLRIKFSSPRTCSNPPIQNSHLKIYRKFFLN